MLIHGLIIIVAAYTCMDNYGYCYYIFIYSHVGLPSFSGLETPVFMPVGTQGTMKGVTVEQLESIPCNMILANTYHMVYTRIYMSIYINYTYAYHMVYTHMNICLYTLIILMLIIWYTHTFIYVYIH